FFFQAEDGIRDATVTGVQTCALPISKARLDFPDPLNPVTTLKVFRGISRSKFFRLCWRAPRTVIRSIMGPWVLQRGISGVSQTRSEERRVGKECRRRGSQ